MLVLDNESSKNPKVKPLCSEANLYRDNTIPPISVPLHKKHHRKMKTSRDGECEDSSADEEYDNQSFREKLKHQWRLKAAVERRKYQKMKEDISGQELKDLWSVGG